MLPDWSFSTRPYATGAIPNKDALQKVEFLTSCLLYLRERRPILSECCMSILWPRSGISLLRPKLNLPATTTSFHKARIMTSIKRKGDVLTGSAEDLKRPKKDGSLNAFFGAPKPTAQSTLKLGTSPPEGTPLKFDKEKWVASLKDEQRKLLKLEIDTLDPSWLSHLKNDLVSPEFLSLKRFLQQEVDSKKTIFPPLEDVYSWYVECQPPGSCMKRS
jgi:hypothetical protein